MSYFDRWFVRKGWDESKHPRVPAGNGDESGQFTDSTNGGTLGSGKEGEKVDTKWLTKIGDQAYRGTLGKYHVTIRKKRVYRSQAWMTYIGTSEADRVLLSSSETMKEAAEKAIRYTEDATYREANKDRLVSEMRSA